MNFEVGKPEFHVQVGGFLVACHGWSDPLWLAFKRERDLMRQALMNNLWDNNPGELERWADDGGYEP